MHPSYRSLIASAGLLVATSAILPAQAGGDPVSFGKVWARGAVSRTDTRMLTTPATLVIDTVSRRLVVKSKRLPLNVSLDQVTKLTFDVSSHMRGGTGGGLGGLVGAAIVAKGVNDHWCVIDHLDDAGVSHRYLLEVGKEQASDVLALLIRLLPSAVQEVRFTEQQREVPKDGMAPFTDDYQVTVLKENCPAIPPVRPESALVVVAAPTVDFDDAGGGGQYRLYANRNIVAVNKLGTYAFFFLAPGTYSLLSKAGNISALDVTVEAGKDYYFFENTFMGFSSPIARLSRQSEALVRGEIAGMYYSEWRPKAR
jgi:hypothetical protein